MKWNAWTTPSENPDFDPAIYAMDLFRAGRTDKAKCELGAFLCRDWRYLFVVSASSGLLYEMGPLSYPTSFSHHSG
jgi:hypothetical protein